MNRKKETYIIPDVPLKDIIQYFEELQINIKTTDILQPNMNTVLRIYESILESIKNQKTYDIISPDYQNDESVYLIVLYNRMADFMKKIGVFNFTHKDIFAPETKKLISHFSAIINFSIFRDNKREIYDQIQTNHVEREELKTELGKNISMGEKKIRVLEEMHQENMKANKEIEDQMQSLEIEIQDIYRHQRDKMDILNGYKAEKQRLQDKISSEHLISVNLRDEITRLKTNIVSDPDKLRELLNEMKIMVFREKEALKMLEEQSRNKILDIEQGREKIEHLKNAVKIAVEINEEIKKIKQVSNEMNALDSLLRTNTTYIDGQRRRIENIERQIGHIESKIANLSENDKKVSEVISVQMDQLKTEYGTISEKRNVQSRKLENNMKMLKDIESLIIKHENEYNSHLCKLKNELLEFGESVFEYFNEMNVFFK